MAIVWLASYPKSGNTWLRAVLTNYLSSAEAPASINALIGGSVLAERAAFDEALGIDSSDLDEERIDLYRPAFARAAESPGSTRFVKTHDCFRRNRSGEPIFPSDVTRCALYLIRNPLDIAVSYANHRNKSVDDTIAHMESEDAELPGRDRGLLPQRLGSWSSHVANWTAHRPDFQVHTARYEDLIENPEETFRNLMVAAGVEVDRDQLHRALLFAEFDSLRGQERTVGFGEKAADAPAFFREGRIGGWRRSLSAAQVERIVKRHADVMKAYDYLP